VKSIVLTTSWDDGHRSDLRLASMLREYGLRATFYISPRDHEFAQSDLLTPAEIRDIASDFEIGAHTVTHRSLPMISPEEAEREILGSKTILEEITGSAVDTFCYPRGAYTDLHVELVKAAGYRYARTVERYAFDVKNPYKAGTSLHIHNHRSVFELRRTARFAGFRPGAAWRFLEWGVLGRAMFDHVLQEGGVFHIWGHSWEIDRTEDWERLDAIFRYISAHPRVTYATNGELVSQPSAAGS
jgi:peptidoglycan-N-acetylglucosamine deacetylase